MGERTYLTDITAMALLYLNYTGSTMVLYDKVKEFDQVINDNLEKMNSTCGIGFRYSSEEETNLYFMATDEEGNLYAVINPSADLKKAFDWHIGVLPVDVIVASQKDNALETIGLQLREGRICKRDKGVTRVLKK